MRVSRYAARPVLAGHELVAAAAATREKQAPLWAQYDAFAAAAREYFGFLEDAFGARLFQEKRTADTSELRWANDTTGVRVSFEPQQGGVWVELYRLDAGRFPAHPISMGHETRLDIFNLGTLLIARDPETWILVRQLQDDGAPIRRIVHAHASALLMHGADVLRGDFKVFPELEAIVRRAVDSPEKGRVR
jgi:hypothetical protein